MAEMAGGVTPEGFAHAIIAAYKKGVIDRANMEEDDA